MFKIIDKFHIKSNKLRFHYSIYGRWHVLHTHSRYAFPLNYSSYLLSLTPIRLTRASRMTSNSMQQHYVKLSAVRFLIDEDNEIILQL